MNALFHGLLAVLFFLASAAWASEPSPEAAAPVTEPKGNQELGQSTAPIPPRHISEFRCNEVYACLSKEELRTFVGKTIRFPHPKPEFGEINIVFQDNKNMLATNAQSATDGTWDILPNGQLFFRSRNWNVFTLQLMRVNGNLYILSTRNGPDKPQFLRVTLSD